jgi:hypothetical protein
MNEKTFASEFKATYQTFYTVTNPATEIIPIGLPAAALVVMVFAVSLVKFHLDRI